MYSIQDEALLNEGMKILCDTLGAFRTEVFIVLLKQKGFDYTEWRRDNLWTGMTCKEISEHSIQVIVDHFDELPDKIKQDIRGDSAFVSRLPEI